MRKHSRKFFNKIKSSFFFFQIVGNLSENQASGREKCNTNEVLLKKIYRKMNIESWQFSIEKCD